MQVQSENIASIYNDLQQTFILYCRFQQEYWYIMKPAKWSFEWTFVNKFIFYGHIQDALLVTFTLRLASTWHSNHSIKQTFDQVISFTIFICKKQCLLDILLFLYKLLYLSYINVVIQLHYKGNNWLCLHCTVIQQITDAKR